MSNDAPEADSPALRRRFDDAMAARDRNAPAEAMRLLKEVVDDPSASRKVLAAAYLQMGYVSKVIVGDLEAAIEYCSRAVENRPRYELGSLALFHALLRADRWKSALEEAERFLTLKRSEEYEQLLVEGFGEEVPADAQDVFARIRALIS